MTETLRIGILGAGWAGESHAVAYAQLPNVAVTALWSRSCARAAALAAHLQQPGLRVYDHWQELIEQGEVDVISVATPPIWRNYLAFRDALRANAKLARAYHLLKLALAKRYPEDRGSCTRWKGAFIEKVLHHEEG